MKNLIILILSLAAFFTGRGQNVGIGTTNPNAKLEVNGNLRITDGTQGANKVLTSDGSGYASWASLPFKNIAIINSSTTWVVPAGVTTIYVEEWGGGGNGSASNQTLNGGGGGGGAYAAFYVPVVPTANITLTVAPGGGTAPLYSQFSYNGYVVNAGSGTGGDNNFAGRGGTVSNIGGLPVFFIDGEDGMLDNVQNFTIGATTYLEYLGGRGGNAPNGGTGSRGAIIRNGYNDNPGTGKIPGGGSGAQVAGTTVTAGAQGLIVIHY